MPRRAAPRRAPRRAPRLGTRLRRLGVSVLALCAVSVGLWAVANGVGGSDGGGAGGPSAGSAAGSAAGSTEADPGEIERVVDGDTVIVRIDGESERVRLLNVDTPESVDPNRPVGCLGPEASAFLAELLPEGTDVTLEYDAERLDRYDRVLAGMYLSDGTLVNAEIARQGFAMAVEFDGNDRFLGEVQAAVDEAQRAGRGLWADDLSCAAG